MLISGKRTFLSSACTWRMYWPRDSDAHAFASVICLGFSRFLVYFSANLLHCHTYKPMKTKFVTLLIVCYSLGLCAQTEVDPIKKIRRDYSSVSIIRADQIVTDKSGMNMIN